jgi:hypothetical protein
MAHCDAECGQGDLEGDTATAAWAAGEDGTVEFLTGVKPGWVS